MIMIIVALLLGMITCLLLGVPYIDFLHKKMFKQYVREEAPETHKEKNGTPTTGGVFIIFAVMIASVITLLMAQKMTATALIILMTLLFYALAGFQDDYIKIKGKENKGLSAKGKFLRQVAISLLPTIFVTLNNGTIIFFGYNYVDLGILYPFLAVFIITGASNAFNLTDGLDGLAASTGMFTFLACAIMSNLMGSTEAAVISAAVCGALLGFLKYNKPKAKVFMGDTGSLALGGVLGTLAIVGKFEFWLIIVAGIFIIETLSVIFQVTSFKLTGKRIFKMTPIHHHFELCGWKETKIVKTFAIVSCFLAMFGLFMFSMFYVGVF